MTYRKVNVAFIITILILSFIGNFFLIEKSQAIGTTIYVDDSNTAGPWNGTQNYPYKTIHEGITASNPGDTIFVSSGTYNENLVINKDLTLIGENKDTTFIDGGNNGHTVNVQGTFETSLQVYISKLTIRNAGGSGNDCIHYSYATGCVISDNRILNSQEGEGISIDHCQGLTIRNNAIINNKVVGISLVESEQNIIENNIIQNNQKGIQFGFSFNNQITSNTISYNTVYGVYVTQSSSNVFSLNDFSGNNQNAQDLSTNFWSSNNQGNYWDDYNNYDNNSDGIGDTPYTIPGINNRDDFPLGYFKQQGQSGGGNQLPIAITLSISQSSAVFNDTITFSGEGSDLDGYIVGYLWRSSLDGTLDTKQSFSTSKLSIGTHMIYFKVMDNDAAWSIEKTASITINPLVNNAPTAIIDEITPNPAKQAEIIIFRGHGSDKEGAITGYKWLSIKDGVLSTSSSFITMNLSLGTHTIYFQVKDSTEWSSQVTTILVIERNLSLGNPNNQAPFASIGGPYHGNVNETIKFDGSLSYDEEGTIVGYWNFGDNLSGTGLLPTHMYSTPGTYTVTLTVVDEEGESTTASTSAIITQSTSQANNAEGVSILNVEIPFSVLIIVVFLLAVGIVIGFILKIKQR